MHDYSFEKLLVWQKGKAFAVQVYKLTRNFPVEERFGLTNQLRRASVSIAANIAEGSSRKSNIDKSKFTNIAYTSLMEVLSHIIICKELNYLKNDEYEKIRTSAEELGYLLTQYLKSQQKNINPQPS